jgi:hypothetical protein
MARRRNPWKTDERTELVRAFHGNSLVASRETKKERSRAEAVQSKTWEELLQLHKLDFWHCTVSQWSQAGWPDYVVFGDKWMGFVELKARSTTTNQAGRVSTGQRRYQASIQAAGGEWRHFLLPDDWQEVDEWLNSKTHREIWGVWRR